MNRSFAIRPWLAWTAAALAALLLIAAGLAAAVGAGHFRGPIIRLLSAHAGRPLAVAGNFEAHLLSLTPRVIAEGVTIGNPAWVAPGVMAQIDKVSVTMEMPGWHRSFGIARLELDGATLHLARDPSGHANWQWTDPDMKRAGSLPLIRSLSMPDARVLLDDARRHLQFDGTVSAREQSGTGRSPPLQLEGSGQLNGKAATFEITADALAAASHQNPYHFTFAERSSGSRLMGHGQLLRAYDFDQVDAAFTAEGADMKDLYFLAGVTLINTGAYHLSGTLARRGAMTRFADLAASSGQSDVRGTVSIDSSSGRSRIDAQMDSRLLRLSDIGARAAGRESETGAPPLLLSDAKLNPKAVRRADAVVNYRADTVEVGRVPLRSVSAKLTIAGGIIVGAPLSAEMLGGKLTARFKLDATTDDPAAQFDLKIAGLQIAQIPRKNAGQAPFEGSMQARLAATGHGRSIHEVAAGASGTVSLVLPHGALRVSLAELAGTELGGLGRLLAKDKQETAVRCAVASFQARQGTLTAQRIVVDTDPVLITGEGTIHLDSEALDLAFRGEPKKRVIARLRSPVLVRGTLSHPSIALKVGNSAAQGAGAVALDVVLTPLAAVLAFVDPGLAKDADCAALIAAAKAPQTATAPQTQEPRAAPN